MLRALLGALLTAATPGLSAPDAPLIVRVKRKPGDTEWKEVPSRTLASLPGLGARQDARSRFGGWRAHKTRATGFFCALKIGDRWWLVDPEGYRFLHVGVNSVSAGATGTRRAALTAKFGTAAGWAEKTTALLRDAGFNGAGSWSDGRALRAARTGALAHLEPLVYASMGTSDAPGGASGGFMQAFGRAKGLTRQGTGHTNYPNDCIPVFHPDFAAFCDAYARPLAALKNDPYLLGTFSDNEMPVPRLEKYLALKPEDPEMGSSRRAAQSWLDARKGKPNAAPTDITDADRDAWTEHVYDRYFAATTSAIRRSDPNHLCLGSRLYSSEKRMPGVWRAAGKYLDVIAVNHYGVWDPKPADLARWTAWSGKPVIITEWYAKGMDSGFANTSGAGWVVPTQKDRGIFYQTFTLGLLESKNCVGWHWFKYQDNDPGDRSADPSNQDSNKGIVNNGYEPYAPLLDQMRALNNNVYTLTDYFDRKEPRS